MCDVKHRGWRTLYSSYRRGDGKVGRLLLATLIKVLAFCVIKIMAFWLIAFSREVRGSNVAK
jgi:hypothetical protein